MINSALFTDFYELTMMQGYYLQKNDPQVVFDMFYRNNPFSSGYAIFAGIEDFIKTLKDFRFSDDDIEYLRTQNQFTPEFLDYLKTYRFSGTIYAVKEGTVVFPQEPLVRIHSSLIDAQLVEGLLLNTVNFQTLIATKSARICQAAGDTVVMEFGMRRAQGENGANSAARAAYVGGAAITSNTYAAKLYGIPTGGTMAHSWIMSFDSELEAFKAFAEVYPDHCVLLIDTYDTLGSGIENAIIVGKELKKKGKKIGVRIDSGDLSYLSRAVRKKLDDAGLEDATICVSNDLSEEIIQNLVSDGVPIDSWGVGTKLATGGNQSALNGVYKLCAKQGEDGQFIPTLKISNSFEKTTNPGIKQVYRFYSTDGNAIADLIGLEEENLSFDRDFVLCHPFTDSDFFKIKKDDYSRVEPLMIKMVEDGEVVYDFPSLKEVQNHTKDSLSTFHRSYKRFINPHVYKVSLTKHLKELKRNLIFALKE